MTARLRDKVVLITGPARGIGEATARQLAARGARLSLVGMEPERLAALAAELGSHHVWFPCDVTDQRALDDAVARTVETLGGIDVVVANAGIAAHGTMLVADVEALVRVIDVNVSGVIRTVKATLPHIVARNGYVLIVSSAAAFSAMPGLSAYAASKAAVEQLANVLRLEMAVYGVEVGSAHMSWIDTDLVRDVQTDLSAFNRTIARLPGPYRRITTLDACARAFVGAIETRARQLFVPKALGRYSAIRQLLASAFAQRFTRRAMNPMIEQTERDVQALGRGFGANSVGMGRSSPQE
jgi:NAD(P)-dependent dehydrogenase (short-subunit alcohol dehydrogenase family)